MHALKTVLAIAAAVATLTLAGCGGGGADIRTTTTTVSVGQQMIDLKKARDSGSISQSEYERLKQQLMDRVLD
jgi:hypothetical protein